MNIIQWSVSDTGPWLTWTTSTRGTSGGYSPWSCWCGAWHLSSPWRRSSAGRTPTTWTASRCSSGASSVRTSPTRYSPPAPPSTSRSSSSSSCTGRYSKPRENESGERPRQRRQQPNLMRKRQTVISTPRWRKSFSTSKSTGRRADRQRLQKL